MKKQEKTENQEKEFARRRFPTFGHFPADKWEEYNRDVEENWSGVRWAKAMNDHEIAKTARKEEAMWEMILELKKQIAVIAQSQLKSEEEDDKKEEDKGIQTLGGNVK